jgi:hypothetical protein
MGLEKFYKKVQKVGHFFRFRSMSEAGGTNMRRFKGPLPKDPKEPIIVHTMAHAIEGEVLFATPADVRVYEKALAEASRQTGTRILACSPNYNHHHEVLQTSLEVLPEFMRILQRIVAIHTNRSRDRKGYVFFQRYLPCIKLSPPLICKAIAYVSLNPFKDGAVRSFTDRAMDCHRAYLGLDAPPPFVDLATGLSFFAPTPQTAREAYKECAAAIAFASKVVGERLARADEQLRRRFRGQMANRERRRYLLIASLDALERARRLAPRVHVDPIVLAGHILVAEEGVGHRDLALLFNRSRYLFDRSLPELEKYLASNKIQLLDSKPTAG